MSRWQRWGVWGAVLVLAGLLAGGGRGREFVSPLYPPGPVTLVPGSLATPSLVANTAATSGWYWPLASHVGIAFESVESYRFHATALTLHHTAAIRFWHSGAWRDGAQRSHLTALRVSTRGASSALDPDGADQIVVGHAGTILQLEGLFAHVLSGFSLGYHLMVIPDNGQSGTGNGETVPGDRAFYGIECSDPDNCAITMATTGVRAGQLVRFLSLGHGAITFADSGSQHIAGAFTGTVTQTITLLSARNRSGATFWVEVERAAN